MSDLFKFLASYEIWIYLGLGLVAFLFLRRLLMASAAMRSAQFGLEREIAQRRFTSALTVMILVGLLMVSEFLLITFILPAIPAVAGGLPTPTMAVLTTPTPILAVTPGTPQPATPTVPAKLSESCTPGKIEWSSPKPGDEISGKVDLQGTVNVENLGFYKFEFSQPGSDTWTTIAADTQNNLVNTKIGVWDTTLLVPGDYLLRLVVADNQNLLLPACVLQVRIIAPEKE